MIARNDTLSPRVELTGAQRSLLEERLQRARQMAGNAEPKTSIPRRTTKDPIPLSFNQERLWFLDQLEPDSPVYNLCQGARLKGALDVGALEKSLNEIIARHEILRTNFVAMEGNPVQVIAPERSLVLNVMDLTGRDPALIADELARRLADESRRPFDLSRDVLLRALLVRTAPMEHTLLLTMHHIISDGWSVGVLFRELETLYAAHVSGTSVTLPELPLQFADFVLWDRQNLRGATLEKLVAYWKKQFGGSLPVLELPTDHPRAAAVASRGAALTVQLPRPLTASLTSIGQQEGATLFMTLLAAFQVLLYRWSEQEDIVVGSVVAGRRKVELEKLIGFFVSTLVLRGDLSGSPTFRQLLGRARETVLGALAHQELPFEELVKALRPDRTLSRNPLFQVMFILQNQPMAPSQLPGLTMEPLEVDTGTAKFDLTLSMMDTPAGLVAGLEYNAELFEAATMRRFLRCFQTLLENIVAHPEQRIADLGLLTPAEHQQLTVTWNETRRPYPSNRCLHDLFAEQAARTPTALAVVGEHCTLTYRELAEQSSQVARRLRAAGIGPGSLVGIFLSRTPRLLVGLLGVLKAGGAYVPLDPAYPQDRLNYIVGHAGITALLTENGLAEKAPATSAEVIRIDDVLAHEVRARTEEATTVSSTDLAYVIYTSGSTGRPKGVAIEHRSVVALISWARDVYTPAELAGTLASTSACFDVSVFEMFVPLCCGGSVIVAENILQLPALDTTQEITLISSVPSAIAELVRTNKIPASVRTVNTAGEPCPQSLVDALYRHPHIQRVLDLYGPTETTVYSTYSVRQAGATATIGRPLANEQVYILDRSMQPVPIGVAGELYIGGDGLARGYLHQAELTQQRFVADPFHPGERLYRTGDRVRYRDDGNIEFLGRLDHQVKLRGYRIELEEIETVLLRHRSVRECAARVRGEPPQEPRLIAYVVPSPGVSIDSRELRQYLQERLPEYMVPAAIVELAKLPLTPNGKLDLKALPSVGERTESRAQFVAPTDEVEQQLVAIWEEVLGVKPVGTRDRFFDLGGHSLLAVRMVAQIEKKFGRKLPVAAVFQHRTVEELAPLLRSDGQRYSSASSIVEIQGHGHKPPLYFVHGIGGGMFWGYANLARHLSTEQPVYAFKSRGLDDLPEWPTIEAMAASYVADLRAKQPQGPYLLGGYCFGGTVAFEMARQLQAQNQQVEILALINCSPPNTGYFRTPNRRSLRWQIKFLRNLFYWAGCFAFRWTIKERLDFVRWKLRALRRRVSEPAAQDAKEVAVNDIDELLNLADYSDRQRQVWQHHVRCLYEYHPQPYAGRVTLFRTGGHPLLSSFDDQFGWGELARGGVEVRLMPGGHGNILDEPHVRAVAQSIQSCLRDFNA